MTKKKLTSEERHVMGPERRYAVIPLVELMNGAVLTSSHLVNTDKSKLIMGTKDMSFKQVVVAAGPGSQLKVGDWVNINVDMFPKEKLPTKHDQGQQYKVYPPVEHIGGTKYLFIGDRFVKWIIKRAEAKDIKIVEAKPKSDILILPK
jgi:hypothetical protein